MTLLKKFTGLLALTTLLFSCQKEMSVEVVKSPIVIDATWQFTESGKTFMGEIDTAYIIEATGFNIITLQGTTEDGITGQIILEVAGETVGTGTYNDVNSYFLYAENGSAIYNSISGGTDFSITITKIDSISITGTFSGTVKGADGTDKTIVDGKFTAPIDKENLGFIEPDPNNNDYFTFGTQWIYANENDPGDMVTITTVSDTLITVGGVAYPYTIFENSKTGEHKYYRKDGNNFYEFTVARLGNDTEPDYIDLLVLKQDGVVGDFWETDPYTISSVGLSINGKIHNSILARDNFTLIVNGFKYENLIEVDTELYIQLGGGDYESDNRPSISTFYSKGIGIIGYYDFLLGERYYLKSFTP